MKLPKLIAIAGVLLSFSAYSHAAKLTCENGYYAEVEGGKLISITIPSGNTFKGNRYWSYNPREKTVIHSLLNESHKCSDGYKPPKREEQIENLRQHWKALQLNLSFVMVTLVLSRCEVVRVLRS